VDRCGSLVPGLDHCREDAANFEELVQVCRRLSRWEFMLMDGPLRFKNATGSPMKLQAIF